MTHLQRIIDAVSPYVAPSPDSVPQIHACTALQAAIQTSTARLDIALGRRKPGHDAVTEDTFFDIASVSKLFTATLAFIAIDEDLIGFDTPVRRFYPVLKNGPTVLQLLNHSSGFPAWDPFYLRNPPMPSAEQARQIRQEILAEILAKPRQPAGSEAIYSDLGYIVLGRLLEQAFDDELDTLVYKRITDPLEMHRTRYVNQLRGETPIKAAVTEVTTLRPSPVEGFVHDENCYIQGGVAGHAGVFSTASDLVAFGRHMLSIFAGSPGLIKPETLRFAWSRSARGPNGHHVAGWDTPSGDVSSVGRGFARDGTFGHLGFTGTSLWLDTTQEIVAALLTNRVFPTRENPRIKDLRVAFHEAVSPPT